MKKYLFPMLIALCGAWILPAAADVEMVQIFQSHAILQCDHPLPIWAALLRAKG